MADNEIMKALDRLEKHVQYVKSEAIKDFAERLKKKADYYYLGNIEQLAYRITAKDLDNLVKEMVGEDI